MAKNKIIIDVEVNGKMQKATVDAKKLSSALDTTGKSARTADRNLKGAAKASANSSKNFSKMAQGMQGGLVPAYAELAARIFAISAAFNFLKDAGDLKALQDGQIAYASATGIAMRTLTSDVIRATDAQISFRDAAQATAIGTAAGLNADQLTRLGKAAKDASLVLGRDVTDSFNRLIRGVTKAEPELLDELGIILRLEDATTEYAAALNLNRNELTQFQRSQAVVNDVLSQAEQKYSKIIEIVDPSANKFAQLGKAFDTIVNDLRNAAVTILTPLAELFIRFPEIAYAGFILIGQAVLTSAIPALSTFATSMKEVSTSSSAALAEAREDLKSYEKAFKAAQLQGPAAVKSMRATALKVAQEALSEVDTSSSKSKGIAAILEGDLKKASPRMLSRMRTDAEKAVGIYGNMSDKMRFKFISALNDMELANAAANGKMVASTATATTRMGLLWKSMVVGVKSSLASLASFAVGAANLIARSFFWLQIAAVAVTTLGALGSSLGWFGERAEESSSKTELLGKRLESVNEEFKDFSKVQEVLLEDTKDAVKVFGNFGNVLNSISIKELNTGFEDLTNTLKSGELSRELEFIEASLLSLSNFRDGALGNVLGVAGTFGAVGAMFGGIPGAAVGAGLGALVAGLSELSIAYSTVQDTARNGSLLERLELRKDDLAGSQVALMKYLQTVEGTLDVFRDEGSLDASKPYTALAKALDDVNKATDEELPEKLKSLLTAFSGAQEYGQTIVSLGKQTEQLNEQYVRFANTLSGVTTNSSLVTSLSNLIKDTARVMSSTKASSDEYKKLNEQLQVAVDRYSIVLNVVELEQKKTLELNKIKKASADAEGILSDGQMRRFKISQDLLSLEQERIELEGQRKALLQDRNESDISDPSELLRLQTLDSQLDILTAQEKSLERQLSIASELSLTIKNSFEEGFRSNLADIIKAEESSLTDAIRNLAVGVLESIGDVLAARITDNVVDFVFPMQSEADKISIAMEAGKQKLAEGVVAGATQARAILGGSSAPGNVLTSPQGEGTPTTERKGFWNYLVGSRGVGKSTSMVKDQYGGYIETTDTIEGAGARTGIFGPFVDSLGKLFSKDAPFLESLGSVFKDGASGFGMLFSDLFSGIMGLLGGSGGLGSFLSGLGSLLFANGGVASGGFRAFANGGMVTKPTLGLVGEGKYNEAIVPLPDGKSIPVMMGGASGTNNITVNVSVDGNMNTQSQGADASAGNLGNVIAAAVQKELQNQKRSGGILNPYGVS